MSVSIEPVCSLHEAAYGGRTRGPSEAKKFAGPEDPVKV